MEDEEFLAQLKQKVEASAGSAIDLHIDQEDKRKLVVDFTGGTPRVVFGADVIEYPGLARMFSQYAILSIRERRQVSEMEFQMFLRRN